MSSFDNLSCMDNSRRWLVSFILENIICGVICTSAGPGGGTNPIWAWCSWPWGSPRRRVLCRIVCVGHWTGIFELQVKVWSLLFTWTVFTLTDWSVYDPWSDWCAWYKTSEMLWFVSAILLGGVKPVFDEFVLFLRFLSIRVCGNQINVHLCLQ